LTVFHIDTAVGVGAAFADDGGERLWREGQIETEKEHVRRCLKWIKTIQEHDGVRVPKKLRLYVSKRQTDDLVRVFTKQLRWCRARSEGLLAMRRMIEL